MKDWAAEVLSQKPQEKDAVYHWAMGLAAELRKVHSHLVSRGDEHPMDNVHLSMWDL